MRTPTVFCLCLVACGGGSSATAVEPAAIHTAPARPAQLHWTGNSAAATILLRPERWPSVRSNLRAALAQDLPGDLEQLLAAATFEDLIGTMNRRLGGAIRGLPGMDPAHPIVMRLFEPRVRGLGSVLSLLEQPTSPVRHVIVLPATDPTQLAAAIDERLVHLRCERGNGVHDCQGHEVRIHIASDVVALVVDGGTEDLYSDEPDATMQWAEGHAASVRIRFSALHQIAGPYGAFRAGGALRNASAEYRPSMGAVALSEILHAHARTSPWMEELDEMVIAVHEQPASFVGVAHLSARGTTLMQELRAPAQTPTPATTPFRFRTGFDVAALRAAAPRLGGTDDPDDVINSFQVCGFFCAVHALSHPFAAARLFDEAGAREELATLMVTQADSSLAVGEVVGEIDSRQLASNGMFTPLSSAANMVNFRARLQGGVWVGAIGLDELPPLESIFANVDTSSRPGAAPPTNAARECYFAKAHEASRAMRAVGTALVNDDSNAQSAAISATSALRVGIETACGDDPRVRHELEGIGTLLDYVTRPTR